MGEDDLCRELGQEYCSENYYALRCRRTCELCPPVGTPKIGACLNKLSHYTCSRYFHYGWCERPDTRDAVRLQCAQTCDPCAELTADREVLPLPMLRKEKQKANSTKKKKEKKKEEEKEKK